MTHIEQMIQDMCPNGVEFKTLGEVTRTLPKGTLKTTDLTEEGYPVINSGKSLYGYYSEYNNDCQAVTIAARGEYAGWISYFNEKFWAGGLCYPYTSKDEKVLMTRFLYFWLKREEGTIMDTLVARGSIPALNKSDLDQLEIPIPPLEIQQKIVECLDKFSALAAELQAELQMRRKQYEYYRTQLLTPHSDCNSADKPDDCNWEWKTLGEIASFKYGYTAKAKDLGNARYIRITDIDKNGCITQDAKYLDMTPEAKEYILQKGDVVMARTGATFGKTLYYNEDYTSVYASFLIKICLDSSIINSRYYWHFAQSQLYWEQANKLVGGGAQPQFNAGAVSQIQIPFPPLAEQERIVSILDKFEALTTSLSDGIPAEQAAQQKRYEYFRDLLLTFDRKTV